MADDGAPALINPNPVLHAPSAATTRVTVRGGRVAGEWGGARRRRADTLPNRRSARSLTTTPTASRSTPWKCLRWGGGRGREGGGRQRWNRAPAPRPSPPPPPPPRQHIRGIADPEHPHTLEALGVVSVADCDVRDARGTVAVRFTPTVAHCSMATLIGLCLKTALAAALPPRFKVGVTIAPGAHSTEGAVNRQLADKERVAAALAL